MEEIRLHSQTSWFCTQRKYEMLKFPPKFGYIFGQIVWSLQFEMYLLLAALFGAIMLQIKTISRQKLLFNEHFRMHNHFSL